MDFKTTDCYKSIKNSSKIVSVPYYVKTDIIVTEDNFEALVDLEEIKYKMKIDALSKEDAKSLKIVDLRKTIEERIQPFIDSNLLELKYAYFSCDNVDVGYVEIEKDDRFNIWLIK